MIVTQFMMTQHDVTIPDAFEVYDDLRTSFTAEEIPWVGFKNLGHPIERLRELGQQIVDDGRKLVVEVVGEGQDAEREAALAAADLGAAILIGGLHPDAVLPVLQGTGIGYYPAVGDLATEPGRVHGSIEEIVEQARIVIARDGVDGIMLLGFRYVGDVPALLEQVGAIPGIKVVNAGTVNSAERIQLLKNAGFWAFTIGSAVLERALPAGPTLRDQLDWVLAQAK